MNGTAYVGGVKCRWWVSSRMYEAARWLAVEAQVLLGFTPKDNSEEWVGHTWISLFILLGLPPIGEKAYGWRKESKYSKNTPEEINETTLRRAIPIRNWIE